ncbi:MAG: D-tyrosyl-tRNA(Tyr) deacylase [Ignavibacteriales bacterium]|nr:D-tyrosyl-tRNA(Tyr) deacylase [Ignavibacteriales bacterium]
MRALIQRVSRCTVSTAEGNRSNIGAGLLIFFGVGKDDTKDDAHALAQRCAALRCFQDHEGKMNLSVRDVSGEVMVVSQFTLYADTRKGNRPGYTDAADPEKAEDLYDTFVTALRTALAPLKVATGVFRAEMSVELVNQGPVTLLLESKK